MKHGFIAPEKIETREEGAEHVLGAITLPGPTVNPTGDGLPYAFERESQQQDGIETYACSIHNSINQIENAIYKATGIKTEYSKRYVANVAVQRGILNPNSGSNPHDVLELMRKVTGMLLEDRLPWNDDYYTVDQTAMAKLLLDGPAWYKDWELSHYWLWAGSPTPTEKRAMVKDALTKGTVCCSVYAWIQGPIDSLYVKPSGANDGHWTGIVQAKGTGPYVCHDSYEPYIKKLDPLFDFSFGKLIVVTPKIKVHTFLKSLRFGMTDPEVPELQKALISLGYEIPHATSYYYGPETRKAVWKFQLDHDIIGDMGEHCGPRTLFELNSALQPAKNVFGEILQYIGTYLGIKLW